MQHALKRRSNPFTVNGSSQSAAVLHILWERLRNICCGSGRACLRKWLWSRDITRALERSLGDVVSYFYRNLQQQIDGVVFAQSPATHRVQYGASSSFEAVGREVYCKTPQRFRKSIAPTQCSSHPTPILSPTDAATNRSRDRCLISITQHKHSQSSRKMATGM
ncbi:hypothetical protein EYF80_034437 [Liparis tanakae]|uniref:Uncharacterized protein n=1 Tax=Liparis tanakae TaxID=230148 RepID=A0A4Z2GRR8_9TELE|nr:hypothetical protein EYF80_034437 [Liparis tanakae]